MAWQIETKADKADWQRHKKEYPSAHEASKAAGRALLMAASRRLFKGFQVRLHKTEGKPAEPVLPVSRPAFVTLPSGERLSLNG
jgi:hypothetical protein